MTYTHYGEMFERLPIFAAAILLGLISGVVAVHLLTNCERRPSIQVLMGWIALAAFLSGLVAAKPAIGRAMVELYALAALVMAVLDLCASCLVDPWRETGRFSGRFRRRMRLWLPPAVGGAAGGTLAVLKLRFDLPLNPGLMPSFAAGLGVALLALATIDLAVRLAVIGLGRCWRMRTAGYPPRPRTMLM